MVSGERVGEYRVVREFRDLGVFGDCSIAKWLHGYMVK